jgi:hypothetical protein
MTTEKEKICFMATPTNLQILLSMHGRKRGAKKQSNGQAVFSEGDSGFICSIAICSDRYPTHSNEMLSV